MRTDALRVSVRVRPPVAAAALATLTVAAGVLLADQQHHARQATIDRFDARAPLAARFVSTYTSDLLGREASIGAASLLGAHPEEAFQQEVLAFGFPNAVLVDSTGHALAVAPANPAVIGTDLTTKYKHLAAGVAGEPTVSDQVGAAANGSPVVGFAAPFDTPYGRRVFSGAFVVGKTPLGAYLDDMLVTPGARAYLVDGAGHVLAGNANVRTDTAAATGAAAKATSLLSEVDPVLSTAMARHAMGSYEHRGTDRFFAASAVAGSHWQVVIVADQSGVLVDGGLTRWLPWVFLLCLSLAGFAAVVSSARLSRRGRQLTTLNAELDEAANADALTGLANRRRASRKLELAAADGPCGVLLIDIDHFKVVNDTHGHGVGDRVLICVAEALRSCLRDQDTLGRWGGEEFLAVLPGATLADAEVIGARALDRVKELTSAATDLPRATVSIGCAAGTDVEPDQLLLQADEALYRAKSSGRAAVRSARVLDPS